MSDYSNTVPILITITHHNMKAFITTTIAFCLFAITCSAQWSGGGAAAIYPTTLSNSVGLGTMTPGLKVHIIGALGFPVTTGTTQTGILRLQGTGSNAVLDFGVNSASGGALQVTNQTDLSLTYPLLLNPNGGSVGIGTVPSFASGTGLEIQQAGPVTLRMENSTNSKSMEFRQTATYFSLFNINAQNTIFSENGGFVGIGTVAPIARLQVYENTAANNTANGITIEQGGTGNALLQFLQTGVQRWTMGIDNANARSFKIATGIGLGTADKFTILTSGNVGIGTTTPDQLLSVNGNIHGKSMIVDLAGLPDYVFHSNYYLPTLESVQAYIDKNHHLQDVPTATEVEKTGMNLGDMNKVLLKKVEELTLYVIDLNKQLKQTQKEVSRLKRKK